MYLTSDDDTDLPCFIYIVYDNAECFSDHVMFFMACRIDKEIELAAAIPLPDEDDDNMD